MKLFAKTIAGLEDILAEEIKNIGGTNIQVVRRGVEYEGDQKVLYRSNYELRTALKILVPIFSFYATNEKELYDNAKKLAWENYLDLRQTFRIDGTVNSKYFSHSHYVSLKVKDAMVDAFREKFHQRPNVEVDDPDVHFNVFIQHNRVSISLDSSSDSLHIRGYRQMKGEAPLNEVLAAGLIAISGWDMQQPFLDPMCGSGTLLIEAAMKLYQIPSGYYRKKWGLMRWKDFDKVCWEQIRDEANAKIIKEKKTEIKGYDKAFSMVRATQQNLVMALLEEYVTVEKKDFTKIDEPHHGYHIVCNPPYGERLQTDDMNTLYKQMGDTLKKYFAGSRAWMITNNEEAMKMLGLKTSRRIPIMNGPLECKFYLIELYEGSKKASKQNNPSED